MKKSLLVALMSAFAVLPAMAQNTPTKGQVVFDAGGRRIAPVDRITSDGSVEIIIDAKEVTIPASTLSTVGGKLTTSLTKPEVRELQQ